MVDFLPPFRVIRKHPVTALGIEIRRICPKCLGDTQAVHGEQKNEGIGPRSVIARLPDESSQARRGQVPSTVCRCLLWASAPPRQDCEPITSSFNGVAKEARDGGQLPSDRGWRPPVDFGKSSAPTCRHGHDSQSVGRRPSPGRRRTSPPDRSHKRVECVSPSTKARRRP
jgi:hypothetical protein